MSDTLDQFITDTQNEQQPQPSDETQALAADLIALAHNLPMDDTFADTLGTKFENTRPTKETQQPLQLPTRKRRPSNLMQLAAAFAIILIGSVMLFSEPSVRVSALEMLATLFQRTDSNTKVIDYVEPNETILLYDRDQASETVPFNLRLINNEVATFNLVEYFPQRNVALTSYTIDGEGVIIQQQPLADVSKGLFAHTYEPYDFGADAQIVDTTVTNISAQYVKGSWTRSPNADDDTPYIWDDTFGAHHLRWQDDRFIYEIFIVDYNTTQADLERIATHLYRQ